MCWNMIGGAAMAGTAMIGTALGQNAQAKQAAAQADAARKQKQELLKQANYQDANLALQQRESWDSTRASLSDARLTAIQNLGMVNAAIAESNIEGNSMNRLQRIAGMDEARQAQGLTDEFNVTQNQLWDQRVGNNETVKGQVDSIDGRAPKRSVLGDALGIASSGGQGFLQGYQLGDTFGKSSKGAPAPIKEAKPATRKGG